MQEVFNIIESSYSKGCVVWPRCFSAGNASILIVCIVKKEGLGHLQKTASGRI